MERLQIKRISKIFNDKDFAMTVTNGIFGKDGYASNGANIKESLNSGEPALVFYRKDDKVCAIIVIGTGDADKSFFTIDSNDLSEKIAAIDTLDKNLQSSISEILERLNSAENKIKAQDEWDRTQEEWNNSRKKEIDIIIDTIGIDAAGNEIGSGLCKRIADNKAALISEVGLNENLKFDTTGANALHYLKDAKNLTSALINLDKNVFEENQNIKESVNNNRQAIDMLNGNSTITGSLAHSILDAKNEIIGTASEDYRTLGQTESNIKEIKDALDNDIKSINAKLDTNDTNISEINKSLGKKIEKVFVNGNLLPINAGDLSVSVKAANSVNSAFMELKDNGELKTTLSFGYDSNARLISLKGKDDAVIGSIDATNFIKDGMLENVSYDKASHKLTLTFNSDSGKSAIDVDLATLVDVYKAGNGLNLTDDGTFSIDTNITATKESLDKYQEGIDAQITTLSNHDINTDNSISEINEKIGQLTVSATTLGESISQETDRAKTAENEISGKTETNLSSINTINETIKGLINRIDQLETDKSTLSDELSKANEIINTMTEQIAELKANTGENTTDISGLKDRLDAIEKTDAALTTKTENLDGRVSANETWQNDFSIKGTDKKIAVTETDNGSNNKWTIDISTDFNLQAKTIEIDE